jgi:patatin-like phospholipase/acyl hydrolase
MADTPTRTGAPFRVLSLDGGGAKGFYTLGALREIESLIGCPLYQKFDVIFGTSTGAIIAAMLALGHSVEEIHDLYKKNVVKVMAGKTAAEKTASLKTLAVEVFKEKTFEDVKTGIGIVASLSFL